MKNRQKNLVQILFCLLLRAFGWGSFRVVFWCFNLPLLPFLCSGVLDWRMIFSPTSREIKCCFIAGWMLGNPPCLAFPVRDLEAKLCFLLRGASVPLISPVVGCKLEQRGDEEGQIWFFKTTQNDHDRSAWRSRFFLGMHAHLSSARNGKSRGRGNLGSCLEGTITPPTRFKLWLSVTDVTLPWEGASEGLGREDGNSPTPSTPHVHRWKP